MVTDEVHAACVRLFEHDRTRSDVRMPERFEDLSAESQQSYARSAAAALAWDDIDDGARAMYGDAMARVRAWRGDLPDRVRASWVKRARIARAEPEPVEAPDGEEQEALFE